MSDRLVTTHIKRGAALAAALMLPLAATGSPRASAATEDPRGKVNFPISCSEAAQRDFNHALALLHHMTYPQAKAGFQRVAELDPECAMAHWGIAMSLFQPLWPTRPGPQQLQQGWQAVQTAKALEPRTERERLYVASAKAFFRDPDSADYWARIRRWKKATEARSTTRIARPKSCWLSTRSIPTIPDRSTI